MKLLHLPLPQRMGFSLKILLTLFAILLAFAVTSGLVFVRIQRQATKQHLLEKGTVVTTMLSGSLEAGLFFEDISRINQAVDTLPALRHHEDFRDVAVYNKEQGLVLRRSVNDTNAPDKDAGLDGPMAVALSEYQKNPAQATAWENHDLFIFTAPVAVVFNQGDHESLYFDTVKGSESRTVIGYAQLAIGKDRFHDEMTRILRHTVFLTVIFLFVALAATYLLTKATLTPLKQLIRAIRARDNEGGKQADEVGLLGDTFSRLIKDLENSFVTIQDLKNGLEDTVAERTQELSHALDELRETHMQLAQSEKMVAIGRLVAGVAHEINNTTNFVSGALPALRKRLAELERLSQTMETTRPDPATCATLFASINQLLENISEGARRTNKIVGDLKTFSRPADEDPVPTDINQCLQTTCSLAYPEYKHRIELTLDLAENLPRIDGVQGQLNQVFMNLLLNAVQAQPGDGAILIRTWAAGEEIHVLIHDNGPGIPAHLIDRIFEPFFTTKEVGKGTGLGLSISYGIIKKHQGQILVRSEPGKGTEFEIILPLMRQHRPSTTTENRQ
jgi:signal transduction histidine kinase